jgi:hypothetical protein
MPLRQALLFWILTPTTPLLLKRQGASEQTNNTRCKKPEEIGFRTMM